MIFGVMELARINSPPEVYNLRDVLFWVATI